MSRPVIDVARSLIRRRKFGKAIIALENVHEIYRESFDYYLTLGIACLYAGDTGNSNRYFQQARHIKIRDKNLLLGQAALYLRRGDTDIAIQYYLDVLDIDPENARAQAALSFIRHNCDYETIVKWVDSGKIEKFYPPIGKDLGEAGRIIISAIAGIAAACLILYCVNKSPDGSSGRRADLTELALSAEEKNNLQEKDLSGGVYRYILTDSQIEETYNQAKLYFQDYRDNSARVEINRLLNSNASSSVKAKANLLLSYFEEPTFDTFVNRGEENFSYADVAGDPVLYIGCWTAWSGRISNAQTLEDTYRCDLLIGYENLERVDGIVPVYFSPPPVPEIEGDRAVRILAKIGVENGKLSLFGRSVYQPLRKNEEK
jgi:hypothetical protein